jgi:hypothetical protein
VAALLVTQTATPTAAQPSFDEKDIVRLVEGLRNGTMRPSFVSKECTQGMADTPDGEQLREVMATYLEVPDALALSAFCEALVQGIKTRDLTTEGLLLVSRQGKDAATFLEVGHFLRVIYFSHRLTTSVSLEGEALQ